MDCGRTLYVDGDDEKANFKEKFSRLAAITVVRGIPVEVKITLAKKENPTILVISSILEKSSIREKSPERKMSRTRFDVSTRFREREKKRKSD